MAGRKMSSRRRKEAKEKGGGARERAASVKRAHKERYMYASKRAGSLIDLVRKGEKVEEIDRASRKCLG